MKKILRYALLASAFVSVFSVQADVKKIAYVTKDKTMDSTATTPANDPIIQMLKADANLQTTVILSDGSTAIAGLDTFDVIVVQEGFGSGDAILKPGASLGIATLPKPFVINKSYGFRSGKALTSGSAAAAESASLSFTVEAGALDNDLFKNCMIDENNAITVLNANTNDLGAEGIKSLNYTTGNVISGSSTLLAQPTGTTDAAIAVNDMPAGTTIDSETLGQRMIAICMNFGSISADNGNNITADGLTIWKNAIYIQAGLPIPGAAPTSAKVAYVTKDKTMDATATTPDNDPIIQALKADANLQVTVILSDGSTAIAGLDTFDVIVVQEGFGSGDAILKPGASLGIATLPKPFVINKAYGFRSGKALTSGSAAAVESPALSLTVELSALDNPLFKNCTIDASNAITVFNANTNDLGAEGVKSLNYTTGNVISGESTLLAQPTGVTDAAIAVNDMPAGTVIDSETLGQRMIAISMNFGSISSNGGTNVTDDLKTIWKNAVYILAGMDIPANGGATAVNNPVEGSKIVSETYYNISGVQVRFPGRGIYIKRTTFDNGVVKASKVFFKEAIVVR